jgi:hypothetical protein
LKRSKPMRRGKPLRSRSKKMEARYAGAGGRRALVARLLKERPLCEACVRIGRHLAAVSGIVVRSDTHARQLAGCSLRSKDVHEILPRSAGGSIDDETNLLCTCRVGHGWVHEHPRTAIALGLRKSRYAGAA